MVIGVSEIFFCFVTSWLFWGLSSALCVRGAECDQLMVQLARLTRALRVSCKGSFCSFEVSVSRREASCTKATHAVSFFLCGSELLSLVEELPLQFTCFQSCLCERFVQHATSHLQSSPLCLTTRVIGTRCCRAQATS